MRHSAQQGKRIIISWLTSVSRYGISQSQHAGLLDLYVGSICRFLLMLSASSYTDSGSFLLLSPNIDASTPTTIRSSKASLKRHLRRTPTPLTVPLKILHASGDLFVMFHSPSVWVTAALNAQQALFDQIMRWSSVLYAMGGLHATLGGTLNPSPNFSGRSLTTIFYGFQS